MPDQKVEVVAGVIFKQGKVLIGERPAREEEGLCWEFPGGRLNFKEDEKSALRRELREELGLEVEIGEKIVSIERGGKKIDFYLCRPKRGHEKNKFHKRLTWISPLDFEKYTFCSLDGLVLKKIRSYLKRRCLVL